MDFPILMKCTTFNSFIMTWTLINIAGSNESTEINIKTNEH